jgi:hypothetical protein
VAGPYPAGASFPERKMRPAPKDDISRCAAVFRTQQVEVKAHTTRQGKAHDAARLAAADLRRRREQRPLTPVQGFARKAPGKLILKVPPKVRAAIWPKPGRKQPVPLDLF